MPTIPKRVDQLSRERDARRRAGGEPRVGTLKPVSIPDPDPDWHSTAWLIWDSMAKSGQSEWYQQSDWAYAWSLCEDISYYKKRGNRSGQMLASLLTAMDKLMLNEPSRRQAGVELRSPQPEAAPASVTAIDNYKRELKKGVQRK